MTPSDTVFYKSKFPEMKNMGTKEWAWPPLHVFTSQCCPHNA